MSYIFELILGIHNVFGNTRKRTQFLSGFEGYIMGIVSSDSCGGAWSLVASVYDRQKVWFKGGTSNEEAIDVWLGGELGSVFA